MMTRCAVLLVVPCFLIPSYCHAGNTDSDTAAATIGIELSSEYPGDCEELIAYSPAAAAAHRYPPHEEINTLPETLCVIDTLYINFQEDQYIYNITNEKFSNTIDLNSPGKQTYTKQKVDCIATALMVENENKETYVVFDANNDEDLSHDKPVKLERSIRDLHGREVIYEEAEQIVSVDYFDGKEIKGGQFLLKILRVTVNNPNTLYSIVNIKSGNIPIGGNNYRCSVIGDHGVEFDMKSSSIWIDSNRNGVIDGDVDFYGSSSLPLSINGISYTVEELDRFGSFISLKESDFPGFDVGFDAPDFTATTLDSSRICISEFKGNNVLLFFWSTSCIHSLHELPNIQAAYDRFSNRDVVFIGIGLDSVEKLTSYISENEIKWINVAEGGFDGEIPTLYRVNATPTAYLIRKDGALLIKDQSQLRGSSLIETLEKCSQ